MSYGRTTRHCSLICILHFRMPSIWPKTHFISGLATHSIYMCTKRTKPSQAKPCQSKASNVIANCNQNTKVLFHFVEYYNRNIQTKRNSVMWISWFLKNVYDAKWIVMVAWFIGNVTRLLTIDLCFGIWISISKEYPEQRSSGIWWCLSLFERKKSICYFATAFFRTNKLELVFRKNGQKSWEIVKNKRPRTNFR